MSCGKLCNCPSYRDHVASVAFAASAMPTRNGGTAARTEARDKQQALDMPAYKRLRANGLQPPRIDGCADLERRATQSVEIETGRVAHDAKRLQAVHEGVT